MKKIITLLLFLTSTLFYAQTSGINYQAVIYNPNPEILPGNNHENTVLSNQDICIRFSIKDALTSLEYQETQKVKTDEFGMVNLIVGAGNQVDGYAANFDAILWNSSTKKLQVEMDVTGSCTNFLEVSNQNFSAVPFAYASKIAENVSGIVPITNGGTGATTVAGAKTNLGLNYVDNTSDANKPVSIATQTALDLKENAANKSTAITLGTSDVLFPTQNAVKTYVDNQITSGVVDATNTTKGKIKLAGDISGTADLPLIANNAVTTAKIADNAVTDAKIASVSSSKIIGSIPVAQVNGAVSKVNGVLPDGDGAVVIPFGMVRTGTLATRPLSSATANGDIYVVSGDTTLNNNGLTFISDGTTWNEVTPNQASLDARYLKLGGGTMSGNIVVPTTKFISIADAPILANDAANKAYVDSKVTGGATPDATTTSLGKIQLAGDLGGTADAPTVPGLTNKENIIAAGTTTEYFRGDKTWQTLDKTTVGLSNVNNTADMDKPVATAVQTALNEKENTSNKSTVTTLGTSDALYPTQNAVKVYVDSQIANATIPDATTLEKGKIQLAGDLGGTGSSATNPVISNNAVTTAKLADTSVTNAKIGEIISVNKGGSGSDMSNVGAGYVKQATNGANFTTVSTIPVADVTGAVRKVNGVQPDTNGNVAVIIGRVFTGATIDPNLATSIINASPAKQQSDIYIVADGSNPNNGRTFIYDGTSWLEVATDLSTTDARYVNVSGDTMEGNLTVPTGQKLIIADLPTNATDAANKNYVDTKVKIKDDGSGTTNFVPKFSAAKTLTDSSIFDDGTKVGIGTTTPLSTLHLNNSLLATNTINADAKVLTLSRPATTNIKWDNIAQFNLGSYAIATGNTDAANTRLDLALNDGSGTTTSNVMTWQANGNVGVGTISPTAKLETVGDIKSRNTTNSNSIVLNTSLAALDISSSTRNFRFSSYTGPTYKNLIDGTAYIAGLDGITQLSLNSKGSSPITFNTTDWDERMRIQPNGNVGIGTNTPANTLEIKQGTAGNSGLRFTNLNSASTATTTSNKVLALNSTGDVILTNVPGTQNIVSFSTASPTTSGVVFTPDTPTDQSVLYQSAVDNSMWTYNGTTYVTYTAPASTAWNLANTTNDAGSNKTSAIWRSGNIGIGINNPVTKLHIQGPTAVQAVNANAGMFRMSRPSQSGVKWDNIAQFNLGTHYDSGNAMDAKSRLDLALTNGGDNTTLTTAMTWLANGNVGIGTTAPTSLLHLVTPSSARMLFETADGANGQASIDLKAGNTQYWRLIGQGSANGGRFDIWNQTVNSSAMSISSTSNVGIGTQSPTARLEVATTSGSSAIFRRGNISGGASNIYLQRTQNADPNVNTAGSYSTDVIGKVIFSMANGTSYPTNGNASIESYYTNAQTATNAAGGLAFKTTPSATVTSTERMRIDHNGNIGIGDFSATAPAAQLHTTGSVRLAGAGTPGTGKVLTSDASGNATWQPVNFATVVTNQTGNFTLTAADSGSVIVVNSATTITVTVPSTFSAGFYCQIIQSGAGQVEVVGSGGITITSALGNKSRAMGSSIGIMLTNSTNAFLSGDTAF